MTESGKTPEDFSVPVDIQGKAAEGGTAGDGLQDGLMAFTRMLEGIVKVAGNLAGETVVRNGMATQWLNGVAISLEDAARIAMATGKFPAGKRGEIACFLDCIDEELKDTKFAPHADNFRDRLIQAGLLLDRAMNHESETLFQKEVRKFSDVAGYFRGAAGPRPSLS